MSRLRTFVARVRGLFGARGKDADLQCEISAHIDEATEDYVRRGLTPAEARRAALVDFGGVVRIEEAYRERLTFRWIDGVRRDARHALMILTKHPTFATIAVSTIALAVAANVVGFAVLRTLLQPLPYAHGQQLVSVIETDAQTPNPETASYATAHDWAARVSSFDSVATWNDAAVRLIRPDGVELVRGMDVSANFFDTLGVPMALVAPSGPARVWGRTTWSSSHTTRGRRSSRRIRMSSVVRCRRSGAR